MQADPQCRGAGRLHDVEKTLEGWGIWTNNMVEKMGGCTVNTMGFNPEWSRFFDDWGSHSRKPPYGRVRTWGIQMAIWMETDDKPVDLGVPNFQTKHRLVGNHYDFTDKTEY